MPIDLKNIEETAEFKAFENGLTEFRKKTLMYIALAPDETNGLNRLKLLSENLENMFLEMQCPDGTVFDPVTKTCV